MKELVKLLIFDWSGTISDDRKPVYQANILVAQHFGVPPVLDFQDWLRQTQSGPQEFFRKRRVAATAEEIWQVYKNYFDQIIGNDGIRPVIFNDVSSVLAQLRNRGKILAVVSSHPTNNLFAEAEEYGILNYFEYIAGSVKDKAAAIADAYCDQRISAENTIYIGDMVSDIIAAKRAGVMSIAVTYGYHSEEMLRTQNPDAIWPNLSPALELP